MTVFYPTPTLHRILKELMLAGSLRDREPDTHLNSLRDCLQLGASLTELEPETGLPPLALAAVSMRRQVVDELLSKGADKDAALLALGDASRRTIDPDRFRAYTAAKLFLSGEPNASSILQPTAPASRTASRRHYRAG